MKSAVAASLLLLLVTISSPAWSHRVMVFAEVENGLIMGEATISCAKSMAIPSVSVLAGQNRPIDAELSLSHLFESSGMDPDTPTRLFLIADTRGSALRRADCAIPGPASAQKEVEIGALLRVYMDEYRPR